MSFFPGNPLFRRQGRDPLPGDEKENAPSRHAPWWSGRSALAGSDYAQGAQALRPGQERSLDYQTVDLDLVFGGVFGGMIAVQEEARRVAEERAHIRDEQAQLEFPTDEISGWGEVLTSVDGVEVRRNKVSDQEGLLARVPKVVSGQSPVHPVRHGLAYQCVEFVKRYYALVFGHDTGYGNANNYLEGDRGGLETHRKENGAFPCRPEKGDLMVDSSGQFGHVGIVKSVSGGTMVVAQQNMHEPEVTSTVTRSSLGRWNISGGWGWDGFRRIASGTRPSAVDPIEHDERPELQHPFGLGMRTHVVQYGESLSDIAVRYNVDGGYWTLAEFNDIADPDAISEGQVINIP